MAWLREGATEYAFTVPSTVNLQGESAKLRQELEKLRQRVRTNSSSNGEMIKVDEWERRKEAKRMIEMEGAKGESRQQTNYGLRLVTHIHKMQTREIAVYDWCHNLTSK
ncbi:Hypothetical predicted protein [Scomber scombrus]|uniref:Uncharacterized protein n=1 Tax=Scomber scombrus TaxID=13677 RepID=A0AAV1PJ50_SCOSC